MANQLLIAMPGMADPNFSTTVTLVCEHNDEGALGIVINRPLELKLAGLFEQLDLESADSETAGLPVLMGGPVGSRADLGGPRSDRSAVSYCTRPSTATKTRWLCRATYT